MLVALVIVCLPIEIRAYKVSTEKNNIPFLPEYSEQAKSLIIVSYRYQYKQFTLLLTTLKNNMILLVLNSDKGVWKLHALLKSYSSKHQQKDRL